MGLGKSEETNLVPVFDATGFGNRLEALAECLGTGSRASVKVVFPNGGRERIFGEEDAALVYELANLPVHGRLPIANFEGLLSGADLAIALFCSLVVLGSNAVLETGFGRPGSSAIYVAAARRIGSVNCERLLFRESRLCAAEAYEACLAISVDGSDRAENVAASRETTHLSIARANLVTWPVTRDLLFGLVDNAKLFSPNLGQT